MTSKAEKYYIVFNGVEIDAPIKDAKEMPKLVWTLGVCPDRRILEPKPVSRAAATHGNKVVAIVWATEEACQLYCDQHNKMMGVGEENE